MLWVEMAAAFGGGLMVGLLIGYVKGFSDAISAGPIAGVVGMFTVIAALLSGRHLDA